MGQANTAMQDLPADFLNQYLESPDSPPQLPPEAVDAILVEAQHLAGRDVLAWGNCLAAAGIRLLPVGVFSTAGAAQADGRRTAPAIIAQRIALGAKPD